MQVKMKITKGIIKEVRKLEAKASNQR